MTRETRALIDTDALASNLALLRSHVPRGCRIIAVVKADCYGHGVEICVPVLRREGVDRFAVATVEEGARLRELGVAEPVIVMAPPIASQYDLFVRHELEAFVSNGAMVEGLGSAFDAAGRRASLHLFVDTGMGRNGVAPDEALEMLGLMDRDRRVETVGLSSHFATSDEVDPTFAQQQLARFDEVVLRAREEGYEPRDVHIANSGGILNHPASHHTAVRPGLSLYGAHPTATLQESSGLRGVMAFRSVVANISRLPEGWNVSYSRRWQTPTPRLIATVPVGYADGLPRNLTNLLEVTIKGRRYRSVGTICMDEFMVDLGRESDVEVGDEVWLFGGDGAGSWEIAAAAGTIPYEIFTRVTGRVPRLPVAGFPTSKGTEEEGEG